MVKGKIRVTMTSVNHFCKVDNNTQNEIVSENYTDRLREKLSSL